MYAEFVKGTGCKQNEHNYKVFCNLEQMYMNTEMTKEEIYEYGKKLVDNSKSEEELRFEAELNERIAALEFDVVKYMHDAEMYDAWANEEATDSMWRKTYREDAKRNRRFAKETRAQIRTLKSFVA